MRRDRPNYLIFETVPTGLRYPLEDGTGEEGCYFSTSMRDPRANHVLGSMLTKAWPTGEMVSDLAAHCGLIGKLSKSPREAPGAPKRRKPWERRKAHKQCKDGL